MSRELFYWVLVGFLTGTFLLIDSWITIHKLKKENSKLIDEFLNIAFKED